GLISNDIYTLFSDNEERMWVGTAKGIDIVDIRNSSLSSITTKEGLVDNEIWTLNGYEKDIYAGTTRGLSLLVPVPSNNASARWRISNYGKSQGLSFLDFGMNSGTTTRKGQFWAGVEGQMLTIIDRPEPDTLSPTTHVTGISILDKPQTFSDHTAIQSTWNQI